MNKKYFEFTGSGSEYFKIWIVNLLLTIVTLGIYSAWAKVRRNQYFYRNTYLAGASFDYHASPIAILKGRIIALVLFVVYSFSINISPSFYIAMVLLVLAILPWLIQRSLAFKLHNSSYRGLRFRFTGSVGGAYQVILLWPILTLASLYLLVPFTHQRLKKYQHNHSLFGQTPFTFSAKASDFYLIYAITFALIVSVGLLAGLGVAALGVGGLSGMFVNTASIMVLVIVAYALIVALALLIGPYFNSRIQNLIWNKTQLGYYQFNNQLQAHRLLFIYLTNILGIIFSLGLYKPFATVRLLKYRLQCLSVDVEDDLQTFIANQSSEISAVGEGAADIFDIDISL